MATKDSIAIRSLLARERFEASFQQMAETLGLDLTRPGREAGGGPEFQVMQELEALAAMAEQIEQALVTTWSTLPGRRGSMRGSLPVDSDEESQADAGDALATETPRKKSRQKA